MVTARLASPCLHAAVALAFALAAGRLPAQVVRQVGPGAIPQIHQAIAQSAPGDVIVVASGAYENFVLDRGLTLVAAPGANVSVFADQFTNAATRMVIPAGQQARVAG